MDNVFARAAIIHGQHISFCIFPAVYLDDVCILSRSENTTCIVGGPFRKDCESLSVVCQTEQMQMFTPSSAVSEAFYWR
jgi:hypothetical protein